MAPFRIQLNRPRSVRSVSTADAARYLADAPAIAGQRSRGSPSRAMWLDYALGGGGSGGIDRAVGTTTTSASRLAPAGGVSNTVTDGEATTIGAQGVID